MKKLFVLLIISLLFIGCSSKNDSNITVKEASAKRQDKDTNGSSENNNSKSNERSLFGSRKTAKKEPAANDFPVLSDYGISLDIPNDWKADTFSIEEEYFSIWINYQGETKMPFFAITILGPEGSDIPDIGLSSDIKTVDGWMFSIDYSYEIANFNSSEATANCTQEFIDMSDYIPDIVTSLKVVDNDLVKAWYESRIGTNESSASVNASGSNSSSGDIKVKTFEEAVAIVDLAVGGIDNSYYSAADESTDERKDVYIVAIRRNKDTVIGSWLEVNKYSGLFRNTGGGSDFAPLDSEINVWHNPGDTFVADGNKVYYIGADDRSGIQCRVCDENGNILTDDLIAATPHEYENLIRMGNFLYTFDTGYNSICKVGIDSYSKEQLPVGGFPFPLDADLLVNPIDDNKTEFSVIQSSDSDSNDNNYFLIYEYDEGNDMLSFLSKNNFSDYPGVIKLKWNFKYHEDPNGDVAKSYTDVSIIMNGKKIRIGRITGRASGNSLEQCPENTIMACRGYYGENNCLMITHTPDELVVIASDVIEYTDGEEIPEPTYKDIMTIELDSDKDILMEAPKVN